MKLILKRAGNDPREYQLIRPSHLPPLDPESIKDFRPFALFTEPGEQPPCQVSTAMASDGSGPVKLTVVFEVDGRGLVVEGDQ